MAEAFLGSIELRRLLKAGHVFRDGSWQESQLRPAAYDLRAARDGLKDPSGRIYPPGEEAPEPVLRLEQGAVAMLSSVERFCMPWTLAGVMGVKFRLARQGILMLTGVSVDPGYGLRYEKGLWTAKDDQRVHFLITNLGDRPVEIHLGLDAVASIQFATVNEPTAHEKIELSSAMSRTTAENSQLATDGLSIFTMIEGLKKEVSDLRATSSSRADALENDVRSVRKDIELTRGVTESLLSLGIFVVLVTFMVGALGLLLSIAQNRDLAQAWILLEQMFPDSWSAAFVAVAILLVVALAIVGVSRLISEFINRRRK